MGQDLASLFAAKQTNQIEWDGPLYSMYELPTDATEFLVRFVAATSTPPQGLRLKIRGGTFAVDDTTASDAVLWEDTAPAEVRVRISWKPKASRSLRIWNAWRIEDVTQAWLGNAAMRITAREDGTFGLRCSDGEGGPDLGDLVVELVLS